MFNYWFYKKIGDLNLGPKGLNQVHNDIFPIFLGLDHNFSLKLNAMIVWGNV